MDLQQKVQNALEQVVDSGLECGCQAAVYIDGELTVNAFAGWTDWSRTRRIDENTLFPIYSAGKPPCSTVLHRLVEAGLVRYDTRIRDFWPEFGCNGKEDMQVWHILSYRAGLFILPKATEVEKADFWTMTEKMAAAHPSIPPGTRQLYHPITYGWLVGGMACHLLGTRDFPKIFRDWVGEPAHMDRFFYGTDDANAATLVPSSDGTIIDPMGIAWMNTPLARRCCNPAACAMSNALSVARHYAAIDRGELLSPQTIARATRPWRSPDDPFEFIRANWTIFGLGYALSGPIGDISRNFGHAGWNGAQGLLDQKRHIAIGFTRNVFAFSNHSCDAFYNAIGFKDRDWPEN